MLIWCLSILVTCGFVTATDRRNYPMTLAFRSWVLYPSLTSFLFWPPPKNCNSFDCVADIPAVSDIDLIKEKTKPGEPVAIIDSHDWAYLVGAHRPPLMLFIPATSIFTKYQLAESLKRLKLTPYLFLPKGKDKVFNFKHDDLKKALEATFHDDYIYDGESEHLVAWKRRTFS